MRYTVHMPGRNFATLFELAADNYGFVTAEDARRIGIRPQRLAEMAARGTLRREGIGLYRLDPFPTHEFDTYRKATLWPYAVEAVLSHETALDLYGLGDVNPAKIHLTVPEGYRIRRRPVPPLYVIHHETLEPDEVTRFEGLPIVTAAKALRQGHAGHLRHDLLRQAAEEARRQGLVTRNEYSELMYDFGFDRALAATR
jgi:predicted transcriptional regulator of viral defense system